ncbi:MAG TPA: hypothetical protein VFE15_07635 [Marmoricola sp.]|jgi:hypothetical protein|nr:hypothetical protein [Marmoricola sp.]
MRIRTTATVLMNVLGVVVFSLLALASSSGVFAAGHLPIRFFDAAVAAWTVRVVVAAVLNLRDLRRARWFDAV